MPRSGNRKYRPTREPFTAPLAVALSREAPWDGCGSDYGPYSIIRYNFLLSRKPTDELGYGDAIENLESPEGVHLEHRRLARYTYSRVTTSGILREYVQTSKLVDILKSQIGHSSPGLASFKLEGQLQSSLEAALKDSRSFQLSETREITREQEVTVSTDGSAKAAVYAVPYERWRMDVTLNHIDYLTVEYAKRAGGARVERVKSPPITHSEGRRQANNYLPSGVKLGKFFYWEPVGTADATAVAKDVYSRERINPLHVDFRASDQTKTKFYGLDAFRQTPSLYKISNAAFPLKAEQRQAAWTDEEILSLQDFEPKDIAWIWHFHRQLRRKKLNERITPIRSSSNNSGEGRSDSGHADFSTGT